MRDLFARQSTKAGMSPGVVVYVGAEHTETPRVRVFDYTPDSLDERVLERSEVAACDGFVDRDSVTWVDVDGVHDVELVQEIGDAFRLHALTLEDIVNTNQRSRLDEHDEHLCLSVNVLRVDPELDAVVAEHSTIVVGKGYVLSFGERRGDAFEPVRKRLREGKGRMRRMGADYLANCLLDLVVDQYFAVLERVGDRLQELEDAALAEPKPEQVLEIYQIRRDLIFIRKKVSPMRETIAGLRRSESPLVTQETRLYLADVHDHLLHVLESIDAMRDVASSVRELHLSAVNTRMNEVMKVLTIMSTVFIPLGFLAGLYGMNFKVMPELEFPWGYPALLTVMLTVAGGMLVFFRRKSWI